ncbi:MAG: glycosyltransferase family 4 protein [Gammaproteobacteria bacterium]|nr:glycosyltransferase family 4 protein [Gammaproteobacteria bacterium]MCF6362745.1 glycosyltransferase family 4 protein [Gammaproteobacteria bacterium]
MSVPLTVLHVEAGRHLYGGALQVVYLLRGLQAEGVRNILICPEGSAVATTVRETGVEVIEAPMGGDADPSLIFRLRRIIRRERPDLVHLHSRRGADLWGGIAARLSGVPAILTRRVDNPEPRWWVAFKYRLYDRVVSISEGIRRVLIDEGLAPVRVTCVHSAVDTERYRPGCADRALFGHELGLAGEGPVLAVVAQLIARKGHRYLLEVLPGILDAVPGVQVVFFGRGPLEMALRTEVERAGLTEQVHFAGFRDDLEHLLPCLDLVVHPAEMEGLGVSLLQAAACGVPIVAFPAGGIPEIVREGENGYLLPVGDVEGLRDRIIELLQAPERMREMGRCGRALVEREFSIDSMVRGNLAVYRGLVGKG